MVTVAQLRQVLNELQEKTPKSSSNSPARSAPWPASPCAQPPSTGNSSSSWPTSKNSARRTPSLCLSCTRTSSSIASHSAGHSARWRSSRSASWWTQRIDRTRPAAPSSFAWSVDPPCSSVHRRTATEPECRVSLNGRHTEGTAAEVGLVTSCDRDGGRRPAGPYGNACSGVADAPQRRKPPIRCTLQCRICAAGAERNRPPRFDHGVQSPQAGATHMSSLIPRRRTSIGAIGAGVALLAFSALAPPPPQPTIPGHFRQRQVQRSRPRRVQDRHPAHQRHLRHL